MSSECQGGVNSADAESAIPTANPHPPSMKPSLRQLLADSHVAAIAIAVLLVASASWAFPILWNPASKGIGEWYEYARADYTDAAFFFRYIGFRTLWQSISFFLSGAIAHFAAAWILSHLVFGVGPFRALIAHRKKLMRNRDA